MLRHLDVARCRLRGSRAATPSLSRGCRGTAQAETRISGRCRGRKFAILGISGTPTIHGGRTGGLRPFISELREGKARRKIRFFTTEYTEKTEGRKRKIKFTSPPPQSLYPPRSALTAHTPASQFAVLSLQSAVLSLQSAALPLFFHVLHFHCSLFFKIQHLIHYFNDYFFMYVN